MTVRSLTISRALLLSLSILLLAACNQEASPASGTAGAFERPVTVATPTLLPGLPTSTAWAANAQTESIEPTASLTPTPKPTPTATPLPAQRLELGRDHLANEDFAAAAEQFQAGLLSDELSESERQEALLGLGKAHLAEGQHAAADEAFGQLLSGAAASAGEGQAVDAADAYYFLAKSYEEQGDCQVAIGAYESYLEANNALAAYVQPRIGECYLALGEAEQAVNAFEAAVEAAAHPAVNVPLRYRLAALYQQAGDYAAAVEQYDAVLASATSRETAGEAIYQAGTAELLAGNTDAAYARYQEGVERYPEAYGSYQALVALVEAGYLVDDFQRGVVDYHAKAYEPAVTVLTRYLEVPGEHNEEAHLYLAWSLEGLGNLQAALDQIQVYIDAHTPEVETPATPTPEMAATPGATRITTSRATDEATSETATVSATETPGPVADPAMTSAAARGTIEKAKMLARAGQVDLAASSYDQYVTSFPAEAQGPYAAWWSAAFAERLEDVPLAIERYLRLAERYPDHEDADEALFRAGYLAHELGDVEQAREYWQTAVDLYPNDHFGSAALIWLMRTAPDEESREELLAQAAQIEGSTYYPLRAQHLAAGIEPFQAPASVDLELTERDRQAAEAWLRDKLQLSPGGDLGVLSGDLAGDGRLIRGRDLWRLGLHQEAKAELESLRSDYAGDPLASYQLANFLRELGLYRSSILAAASVLHELEVDVLDAPRYIAGLTYPTYYDDLIIAEAQSYDYDPLLQFSLVRQESLFESFATSGAAAQGLSQVIPDTGAYIAQRLGWVDFVNEDLYRPYVGIAFGAYYLDQQLDGFDGDIAAALSAYNAGPGNAARWYEAAGGDIDLYVDTIDFSETRQYVERIYAGHAIYRHLYGEERGLAQ